MKELILLLMFCSTSIFAQEYSTKKIKKLVEKLSDFSTDYPSFNDDVAYFVVDNWTSNIIYEKENYVDNDIHKVFLKIIKKSRIEDLILMSKSDLPNIRVYAFWGLLKRNKRELAKNILNNEVKEDIEKVWFDSFGDLVQEYTPTELMKELIRKEDYNEKE
jgi:hypothetical protein